MKIKGANDWDLLAHNQANTCTDVHFDVVAPFGHSSAVQVERNTLHWHCCLNTLEQLSLHRLFIPWLLGYCASSFS